jgi:bifunctional DNA-binding transcriptional regulator/antitoxin component of YhaV-PrlF toxin-antitoxin module
MLSGSFITEVDKNKKLDIPSEVLNRLHLNEGDKVEVLIKKIKSRRMGINISKNPLIKLLDITQEV